MNRHRSSKILIIGGGSFSGSAFIRRLRTQSNPEIFATYLKSPVDPELQGITDFDILDFIAVKDLITQIKPDFVANFTGWTSGGDSHPFYMLHGQGTLNLMLAARELGKPPRILLIGSAAEYGAKDSSELPILETTPPLPASDYGKSKLIQTMIGLQAFQQWGLPVVIARTFNLIGSNMPSHLAPAIFLQQINKVKAGFSDRILTGPLHSQRDFLDIRDAVDAYWRLLECGQPGEIYNVCSGTSTAMNTLLMKMCESSGLRDVSIVSRGRESTRSSHVDISCGSNQKILDYTGWSPEVSLDEAIEHLVRSRERRYR